MERDTFGAARRILGFQDKSQVPEGVAHLVDQVLLGLNWVLLKLAFVPRDGEVEADNDVAVPDLDRGVLFAECGDEFFGLGIDVFRRHAFDRAGQMSPLGQ